MFLVYNPLVFVNLVCEFSCSSRIGTKRFNALKQVASTFNKIFGDPNAGAVLNVFNKQQGSLHDPDKKQRWYNNDLGIPYEEKGSRITDQLLSDACREYTMPRALPQQFFQQDIEWSVMGIDVGSQFHVTISGMWMHRFNVYRIKLYVGNVSEIEDVEKLIKRFNVTSAVIDAFPEQRLAFLILLLSAGEVSEQPQLFCPPFP